MVLLIVERTGDFLTKSGFYVIMLASKEAYSYLNSKLTDLTVFSNVLDGFVYLH